MNLAPWKGLAGAKRLTRSDFILNVGSIYFYQRGRGAWTWYISGSGSRPEHFIYGDDPCLDIILVSGLGLINLFRCTKNPLFLGGGKALLAKLSAKYEVCKTKMFLIKITCQIKLEDQDWREVSEISGYTLSHPGQKRNVLYYKNKIQAILNFQRKGEIAHKFFSQKRRNTKKKFAKFRFFVKFSFAGNRF